MAEGDHPRAPSDVRLVKISDLARMSGVPVGTIKYYLRAGLLPGPSKRTSRNMAYYDARLAERVRVIKQLQHRHGLPLRAIAEMLEPAPSAALRSDLDDDQRQQLMTSGAAGAGPEFSAQEITRALRIDSSELAELERRGLVAARRGSSGAGAPVYRGADLELLEALHEARDRGIGELFSVEALSVYAEAVTELVRQEVALHRGFIAGEPASSEGEESGQSPGERLEKIEQVGERVTRAMRKKRLARALASLTS